MSINMTKNKIDKRDQEENGILINEI